MGTNHDTGTNNEGPTLTRVQTMTRKLRQAHTTVGAHFPIYPSYSVVQARIFCPTSDPHNAPLPDLGADTK
eukprot:1143483-Pelagomonas_calceolata.AAC.1